MDFKTFLDALTEKLSEPKHPKKDAGDLSHMFLLFSKRLENSINWENIKQISD